MTFWFAGAVLAAVSVLLTRGNLSLHVRRTLCWPINRCQIIEAIAAAAVVWMRAVSGQRGMKFVLGVVGWSHNRHQLFLHIDSRNERIVPIGKVYLMWINHRLTGRLD